MKKMSSAHTTVHAHTCPILTRIPQFTVSEKQLIIPRTSLPIRQVLLYTDQPTQDEEPGTTLVVDTRVSDQMRLTQESTKHVPGKKAPSDSHQILRDGHAPESVDPNLDNGWPAGVRAFAVHVHVCTCACVSLIVQ